jgi:AraC-like DNA-binding protein
MLSIFYLFKSFRIYFSHRNKVKEVFSYDEGVSLKWMLLFLIGYILYVISFIVLEPDSSPFFVYIPMFIYLVFIGFMGNKQHQVSIDKIADYMEAPLELSTGKSIGIDTVKRKELKAKLTNLMLELEPYVDSQLTVYQLAKQLGTNSSYLSTVMNSDFEMNFTSYINSYRIEKSKALFEDLENKNFTIEAIGQMAGFKSKSAFNRWFKEFTGETPSTYKKKLKA